MKTNQAETFLNDWADQYEKSEGEIEAPCFAGVDKDYSDNKKIPHCVFEDHSVVVVYNDYFAKTHYVAYESSDELDCEMDLESDALNNEYACVDLLA